MQDDPCIFHWQEKIAKRTHGLDANAASARPGPAPAVTGFSRRAAQLVDDAKLCNVGRRGPCPMLDGRIGQRRSVAGHPLAKVVMIKDRIIDTLLLGKPGFMRRCAGRDFRERIGVS
jgi:hypothetical protein